MFSDHPFSFSFTAASLRPELVRVIAEAYAATGSWEQAKARVLAANALQARSPNSALRMERELRQRLQRLTPGQLHIAEHGMAEERSAIAWLAILKANGFVFTFAADVLRGKVAALDPVLRASDYEAFFENQSAAHPEILELTSSSKAKVRSVLLAMVREAGIGEQRGREMHLRRPIIPPSVQAAVLTDSPKWLAGFLVPDAEIPLS